MERSVWSVHIKSGAITHRKIVVVTPIQRDMVIDAEYVKSEVRRQQHTYGARSGQPMLPQGEIVKCEPRDGSKPLPAASGQWANGVVLASERTVGV